MFDVCVCFVFCRFVSGLILWFVGECVVWWLVCRVNRRQIEVWFSPNVIRCGWLDSKYRPTIKRGFFLLHFYCSGVLSTSFRLHLVSLSLPAPQNSSLFSSDFSLEDSSAKCYYMCSSLWKCLSQSQLLNRQRVLHCLQFVLLVATTSRKDLWI